MVCCRLFVVAFAAWVVVAVVDIGCCCCRDMLVVAVVVIGCLCGLLMLLGALNVKLFVSIKDVPPARPLHPFAVYCVFAVVIDGEHTVVDPDILDELLSPPGGVRPNVSLCLAGVVWVDLCAWLVWCGLIPVPVWCGVG